MLDDKSLISKKENIINKFISFINNLFKKKEIKITAPQSNEINTTKNSNKSFIGGLRKDMEEEEFIKNIINNMSLLDVMPLEELQKLEEAVDRRTERLDNQIKELKTELAIKKRKLQS